MATGNRVIVVSKHSANRYSQIVRGLFSRFPEVVLTTRGRHFARLAEVLKRLRPEVEIKTSRVFYADEAPEIEVVIVPRKGGDGGAA